MNKTVEQNQKVVTISELAHAMQAAVDNAMTAVSEGNTSVVESFEQQKIYVGFGDSIAIVDNNSELFNELLNVIQQF